MSKLTSNKQRVLRLEDSQWACLERLVDILQEQIGIRVNISSLIRKFIWDGLKEGLEDGEITRIKNLVEKNGLDRR